MSMPERIRITDFIQKSMNCQFVIPVYQRKYTWIANKHVKKLLEDFDELLCGNTSTHFLGIIIYVSNEIGAFHREFSVVDGQQRLTTIFLMLQALKHIAQQSGRDDFANIIDETYLVNRHASDTAKFRLKPIVSEDGVYQKIAVGRLDAFTEVDKKTNCYKNYKYIYDHFLKKIESFSIENLVAALSKFQIVYIPLDATDNAQQIFESINSTGVELAPADLIRNFLLMDLSDSDQERFYERYWLDIENKLETTMNVNEFFRFYLSVKRYELVKKDEVYNEFKEWYSKEANKAIVINSINKVDARENLLKDINKYASYYSKIYISSEEVQALPSLHWFRRSKSLMPAAFLLEMYRVYEEGALSTSDFNEIIDLIDSYLVRRALCEKPTSNITRLFPSLLRNVLTYSADTKQSILECTKYCLVNKNKNNLLKMPNDQEVEEALFKINAYSNTATRVVLEKIENFDNPLEIKNLNNLSVEHLLPQTATPYWEKRVLEGQYDDYVNLIGNLTLASGLDNSKMSNKPWVDNNADIDKHRILSRTGHLKLNIGLLSLTDWNSKLIMQRTKELIEYVKRLYKYQESTMQQKSWRIKLKHTTEDVDVSGLLYEDGSVTILSGSEVTDYSDVKVEVFGEWYNDMLESGLLQKLESGKTRFVQDRNFSSISAAAGFVLNGSRNGWEYFVTEAGDTLNEIREKYFSKKD